MPSIDVATALQKMNKYRAEAKIKGTAGEEAALSIIQVMQESMGGIIFHSYKYPYAQNRQGLFYSGNIHLENDKFFEVSGREGLIDEIDIVYITSSRIFAIEVKARGGTWKLYDHWCTQNGTKVNKSPIAQAEKHARHLYQTIYQLLPDGVRDYIIPMVVFVDRAKVEDSRSLDYRRLVPAAVLDNLKEKIKNLNMPLAKSLKAENIYEKMRRSGNGRVYR